MRVGTMLKARGVSDRSRKTYSLRRTIPKEQQQESNCSCEATAPIRPKLHKTTIQLTKAQLLTFYKTVCQSSQRANMLQAAGPGKHKQVLRRRTFTTRVLSWVSSLSRVLCPLTYHLSKTQNQHVAARIVHVSVSALETSAMRPAITISNEWQDFVRNHWLP